MSIRKILNSTFSAIFNSGNKKKRISQEVLKEAVLTRQDVIDAYRALLKRDPESEDCFSGRVGLMTKSALVQEILNSQEYSQHSEKNEINFIVIGNCHAESYRKIIESASGLGGMIWPISKVDKIFEKKELFLDNFEKSKYIFITENHPNDLAIKLSDEFGVGEKIRFLPTFLIRFMHPDLIYVHKKSGGHIRPIYNSRIVFFSYLLGLSEREAFSFFNKKCFSKLGYYDVLSIDRQVIAGISMSLGIPAGNIFENLVSRKQSFMHSINHPKIDLLREVVFNFFDREGIDYSKAATAGLADPLFEADTFPIYPEIGQFFGLDGEYRFKIHSTWIQGAKEAKVLDLREFIQFQYANFSKIDLNDIDLSEHEQSLFEKFKSLVGVFKTTSSNLAKLSIAEEHPYKGLPTYQFWRKSVSALDRCDVDPVVKPKFSICTEDKVATAGSCFAQHISKKLNEDGFNFFVTEISDAPDALENNYGVYSARYGNIYSTSQLLQLFERAYDRFIPQDEAWSNAAGKWIDPFRPQIQKDGFASLEELRSARAQHFSAVRTMFEQADVFVFTLGLTEVWRSKLDGAVFPLAPGVAGGVMDEDKYEFVNLGVEEVRRDLQIFINLLSVVNPNVRVLLTVSPVPLVATYESRHVLSSSTFSKSVLRVAADTICKENENVDYFPSYEIITGNHNQGKFFEEDLRTVKNEGVNQVMKIFMRNYTDHHEDIIKSGKKLLNNGIQKTMVIADYMKNSQIVCDEQALDV